jgi:hypothetical protein
MYFHSPNYSSSVVNTDARGFRVTHTTDRIVSDFADLADAPVNLLIGGSTVFGVGATTDATTLASIMSKDSGSIWLNLGGRAYSSTQEFLLFLFHRKYFRNVKQIVILSGINNLVLYYMSEEYSKELGSFFFWNDYNQQMNTRQLTRKRRLLRVLLSPVFGRSIDYARGTLGEILQQAIRARAKHAVPGPERASPMKRITDHRGERDELIYRLKCDIENWRLVSTALGVKLVYALQPVATWIQRQPSSEETALFAELDRHPGNSWETLARCLDSDHYHWFSKALEAICLENNVSFFDTNRSITERGLDGKWLFVDRVHLTDEGNQVVSNILREEVLRGLSSSEADNA